MIGFDHLGNLGRLGNQMFEYAALRGISGKHGYDILHSTFRSCRYRKL